MSSTSVQKNSPLRKRCAFPSPSSTPALAQWCVLRKLLQRPCQMTNIRTSQWWRLWVSLCIYFILLIFRERGREGERGEKHRSVASRTPLAGDLACNPGLCPDWELNQRPFGSQAGTQSTEPHQPGRCILLEGFLVPGMRTGFLLELRHSEHHVISPRGHTAHAHHL